MSNEFVPIRVSTLRGDQPIDFNAYIQVAEKHILYLRKGDSFEGERLKRLKDKKLRKMFIVPDDENHYRNYLSKNIEMAYDNKSNKNIVTRSEIVQGAQQSNTEEVMENADNVEAYNTAKDAAGRYVEFLKNESALAAIMNIENVDQNIAHHGVTVATLAVALAAKLNITDPKQTQMLTLGSLLHDFEHFHSGLQVNKPLSQFSPDDLKKYKAHPIDGARRVQDKKHFDRPVINIIMQHEEWVNGGGFPAGLTENKMDPLSVIVAPCNALDRSITFESVPRQEAVKNLIINCVGRYPLKYLQLLGEILQNMKVG
jgi:HD-GYP domain-containing protein (c-di-GMP phosphodiesterase class II)